VRNILKNKYSVSLISNNYGDNKQDGIWRKGVSLNIDSPSGIGDNLYFTYLTVSRKNPDRNWKKRADELQPGEILPIGPAGYDPSKGDTLPYKRRLDMFNFGYMLLGKILLCGKSFINSESSELVGMLWGIYVYINREMR